MKRCALLFDENEWVLHDENVLVGKEPFWAMMLIGVKDAELMKGKMGMVQLRNGEESCMPSSWGEPRRRKGPPNISAQFSHVTTRFFYVFE